MTNQETSVANWFSTELSSSVTNSTLTFPVDSIGLLTSPAYIIIEPDNAAKREVILADGTWGASSFVASDLSDRGLSGSAAGAQAHDAGSIVEVRPLAQHIEDLNDRMEGHAHGGGTDGTQVDHGGLGGLGDDDHTQYSLIDGSRANTGEQEFPDGDATTPGVNFGSGIGIFGGTDGGGNDILGFSLDGAEVARMDGNGLGLRQIVTFTSSGTFTKASYPWLRAVRVRLVGGGGGGSGNADGSGTNNIGGAGGGGGGYAEDIIAASSLAASETVTVGAGGAGAQGTGSAGGATSFGTHVVAGSGQGAALETGGDGGAGTTGGILISGEHGDSTVDIDLTGVSAEGTPGGNGGRSMLGMGGPGAVAKAANSNGGIGLGPGGGGGGGYRRSTAVSGGDGADGVVIVELYA